MRKKLPILLLALIILLQVFVPAVYAVSKSKAISSTLSFCSLDTTPEGAGKSTDEFVNLASPNRTTHILYGDKTGGGHLWPGQPGKSVFPKSWSADKVMHNISDIATDPSLSWQKGRVVQGVQRYEVTGVRDGVQIKVITDGTDIITAFPIK